MNSFIKYLLSVLIILNSFSVVGQSATTHAFLICNTADPLTKSSMVKNYFTMENFTKSIANFSDQNYKLYSVIGSEFNYTRLKEIIKGAEIKPDDIVIIYVGASGPKSSKKTYFHRISMSNIIVNPYNIFLDIKKKSPKRLIEILEVFDNSTQKEFTQVIGQETFLNEQFYASAKADLNVPVKENIKNLFITDTTTCSIIINSTQLGAENVFTDQGAIFTNSFIRAFKEVVYFKDTNKVSWDELLNRTRNYTHQISNTRNVLDSLHRPNEYELSNGQYPIWEKWGCSSIRPVLDTTSYKPQSIFAIKATPKAKLPFQRLYYNVDFNVSSNKSIDSVTYFLHYTMPKPKVVIKSQSDNFHYSVSVWGEFPTKAKIFYSDGTFEEIQKYFKLTNQVTSVAESQKSKAKPNYKQSRKNLE